MNKARKISLLMSTIAFALAMATPVVAQANNEPPGEGGGTTCWKVTGSGNGVSETIHVTLNTCGYHFRPVSFCTLYIAGGNAEPIAAFGGSISSGSSTSHCVGDVNAWQAGGFQINRGNGWTPAPGLPDHAHALYTPDSGT
jgi:hypothetical protein